MIALLLFLQFPVLFPVTIFTISYLAPTSYYLDKGFYIKDEILIPLMDEAKKQKGACFEKSLYFADLMSEAGYSGHTIKLGRFDQGDGDYHAWVEYRGSIWESVMPELHYGMDKSMLERVNAYKVYGEISPGQFDNIKYESKKSRQDTYYAIAIMKIESYEREHKKK